MRVRATIAICLALTSVLLFAARTACAQPAEKRVALVIGVGKYVNAPALANPLNDAREIGSALERLGFQSDTVVDPDYSTMKRAILGFGQRLEGARVALFYYAGHGMDVESHNYLLPADFELTAVADLRFTAFDVRDVLAKLEAPGRASLVFLDACRDNPFAAALAAQSGSRSVAVGRGLGRIDTSVSGMLIAYATEPGSTAQDGSGRHSPFTAALLQHIATPGLDVRQMLTRVRIDVLAATNNQQRPWTTESLDNDFYFVPAAKEPAPPPPSAPAPPAPSPSASLEGLFWQSIANSTNRADFEAYLQQFPQGVFAPLARNRLAALTTPTAPPPPAAFGDPAADMLAAKRALAALGYLKAATDAELDRQTQEAILRWQSFEALDETGRLTEVEGNRLDAEATILGALLKVGARSPRGTSADSVKGAGARFDLGTSFERGDGKPKDAAEAAYWYALAAGDGWAAAFTNLGTLYARGVRGKPDTEFAELLWKAAAARDDATAMYNLGAMYERGIGVPADVAAAKRWYARGAEHKHAASAEALHRLGG